MREVGRPAPLLEWRSTGETLESVVFAGPDAVVTGGWRDSGRLRWWWWDPEVLAQKLASVPPRELTADEQHAIDEKLARR